MQISSLCGRISNKGYIIKMDLGHIIQRPLFDLQSDGACFLIIAQELVISSGYIIFIIQVRII